MAHYENHAPVSNQASVQNIYGDVIFNNDTGSHKRTKHDTGASNVDKSLDDDILASLAFPQMSDRRSNIESAHSGTCQWLFTLDEYRRWMSEPHGLLWIKGKPGSGKSTLILELYRKLHLERQSYHRINLEFFFNARGSLLQRTFIGMLRSLLNQIFYHDDSVRHILRSAYREKCLSFGSGTASWQWTVPDLKHLLIEAIKAAAQQQQILLIIDALDEAGTEAASEIASFFHSVNDTVVGSAGMAKICISCRHYPIPSRVEAIEIHMEKYNHADIALYVKGEIVIEGVMIDKSRQDLDVIAEILVDNANNVFQWVRLMIPMVKRWLWEDETTEQIRTNLSVVPKDLEAIYEYILVNVIDPRYHEKTLRLFQWVCLAQRPLSLIELQYALSAKDIEAKGSTIRCHEVHDFEQSSFIMSRRVTTWSGGLLETVPTGGKFGEHRYVEGPDSHGQTMVVQVIHQSVSDFMLRRGLSVLLGTRGESLTARAVSPHYVNPTKAVHVSHSTLYLCCLNYLCTENRSGSLLESLESAESYYMKANTRKGWRRGGRLVAASIMAFHINAQYPFLKYTSEYVLIHAEQSGDCRDICLEYETWLLDSMSCTWVLANHLWGEALALYTETYIDTGATVLHLASVAGLMDLAAHRIGSSDDLDKQDAHGWTPMHVAVSQGHLALVTMLHEKGADVHTKTTRSGYTPLLLAASKGQSEIFSFLLDHGVDVHATAHDSESVLYAAAEKGSITISRLCIEAGVDVNGQGGYFGSALHAAAWRRNLEIVELLLESGANVKARGGGFDSALQAAAFGMSTEIVRRLLDAGADVNAQGGRYGNALQAAAYSWSAEIVEILLEAGADVNVQGGMYGNALEAAALRKDDTTFRLLLEAGADINAQGGEFGNALQAAAHTGDATIVELLLEAGVDVNAKGGYYGNALQGAAKRGEEKTVRLLLGAGADVNAQGGHYGSAIRAARRCNRENVVEILKAAGAVTPESGPDSSDSESSWETLSEAGGDEEIEDTAMDVDVGPTAQRQSGTTVVDEGSLTDQSDATSSEGSWLLQMLSRFFP